MAEWDAGGDYQEALSRPPSPPPGSDSDNRTKRMESANDRGTRVGSLILQAAQAAQQEEAAQATARAAAQIAAQARKMRSRPRRSPADVETPDSDTYEPETGVVKGGGGGGGGGAGMDPEGPTMGEREREGAYGGGGEREKVFSSPFMSGDGRAYHMPLPPAFALVDIGKPGKGWLGGKWLIFRGPLLYRICIWLTIGLTLLSIALGISLLAVFFTLEPKQPTYELEEIRIKWWESWKDTKGEIGADGVPNQAAVYLYADAELVVKAENPNSNFAMHYENTTFDVAYQGVAIGQASLQPHVVAVRSGGRVVAEWKCAPCYVQHAGHYLQADEAAGIVPLQIRMSVTTRAEVGGTLSPAYFYSTVYDVRIRPSGGVNNGQKKR